MKKSAQFIVFIFLIIGIVYFGYYISKADNIELDKFRKETNGTIVSKSQRFQRGFYVEYKYKVNGKTYYNNQKLNVKEKTINVGDSFQVIYSSKKPKNSNIILSKKINL